jgi:hypothetical protein
VIKEKEYDKKGKEKGGNGVKLENPDKVWSDTGKPRSSSTEKRWGIGVGLETGPRNRVLWQ